MDAQTSKYVAGCGGCGCLFAGLALVVGAVLLAFGLQPRTDEALPFGIATLALGVVSGAIALIVLVVGYMGMKKAPAEGAEGAPPQ